ncbi:MAG: 50S ribosomal protein L6 [Spirochaetia bacterium]|nr:50S ribosomal protein L6 [Spirochaetia bacterium]
MSRIGIRKIKVPTGVSISLEKEKIVVTGSKGKLEVPLFEGILVKQEESFLAVTRNADDKEKKAKHGLVRALLANSVNGVSEGFKKTLILQGVGYRAQKKGSDLSLSLGFSHEINFPVPADVTIEIPEPTKVIVSGIDKQRVGETAAQIRKFRPPEPYKGKGVRYEDEYVRRKAGKTGK